MSARLLVEDPLWLRILEHPIDTLNVEWNARRERKQAERERQVRADALRDEVWRADVPDEIIESYIELNEAINLNPQHESDLVSQWLRSDQLPDGTDPTYHRAQKSGYTRRSYTNEELAAFREARGTVPRVYVFDEPEGHKILPPRSALYKPPRLTPEEQLAVDFRGVLSKHFVGPPLKLKPALKKKLADSQKGERRVVFDANGKMKEVKEAR